MKTRVDLAHLEEADASIRSLMPEPGRAERLERAVSTAPNGPLSGLVVGVKDIFQVDGLPTTAGSTLPADELAGPEAAAVSLLRSAGAVVLGKTVSTEFALFEPGPTRNPRNLAHTPGGSSSGSAAAVAAGHCPLALGSQTIGSVIRPAAFCGVVGYKPSYGRISTAGVIPLAESFDTVGLLASNTSFIERAAGVLCAWWQRGVVNHRPVLGIPDGPYLEQASQQALRVLDGLGATRVPLFEDIVTLNAAHRRLLSFEMARHHARWFPRFADRYRPRTAAAIRYGLEVAADDAAQIRAGRAKVRARIHEAMDAAGVDVWVCPAAAGPAPEGLESTGDPSMQLPWTHAGLPVVTLPWGTAANGLPLGLQLVARFMDDERLLAWASQLEGSTSLARAGGQLRSERECKRGAASIDSARALARDLGVNNVTFRPTYDRCCHWVIETLRLSNVETRMGTKLYSTFLAAGPPAPSMQLGAIVGGGANSSDPALLVARLAGTMLPDMERLGVATAADFGLETLADRMVTEAVANGSVLVGWFDVAAWCRV